eukprot:CAMPEP_0204182754 /NCGR_PEP_ID=MMETSP0361-20130328/53008_1 /ASSEMBLY_ACC=CAM_ASM_000343 /TAXON_ID=268821 /ORGANISM="Scrippsiella Hangoei, Strain SHTV-5" /LENGTH=99 /DNA_ID=CAMNT_0051142523 /DNA_START=50 /DNA_END=345 /DNA_ORIENTATION=-
MSVSWGRREGASPRVSLEELIALADPERPKGEDQRRGACAVSSSSAPVRAQPVAQAGSFPGRSAFGASPPSVQQRSPSPLPAGPPVALSPFGTKVGSAG